MAAVKKSVTEKRVNETLEEMNQRAARLRCIPARLRTPADHDYLARHAGHAARGGKPNFDTIWEGKVFRATCQGCVLLQDP